VERVLIIPAAGRGSRLRSDIPKVLYPIAGRPMIDWLFDLYDGLAARFILVLSPEFDPAVRQHCSARQDVVYLIQEQPNGMLPAILTAAPLIARERPRSVWITWCDQVAIRPATIHRLAAAMAAESPPDLAFPTVHKELPYIHFDRDAQGRIAAVRHRREGDDMPPVGEGDSGLFALSLQAYLERLTAFAAQPAHGAQTGERNFLPFIPWLAQRGDVVTFDVEDEVESMGVNTRDDARSIEDYFANRR
jgi:bifunctional N-acetylglucosamine-1-phosphate-uridyltransferase/glucosamine-1-phosphate-acetyltransferase GlmU-like protein